MNPIVLLCIICICIEIEHTILHNPIHRVLNKLIKYNKACSIDTRLRQANKLFRENTKEVVETLSRYCTEDEITIFMINSVKPALYYKDVISDKIRSKLVDGMIKEIGAGKILLIVLQEIIELIYLVLVIAISIMLPFPNGLILFSMTSILSYIGYRNNRMKKNRIWYLHLVDGFTCICMFLMIITMF